MLAFILFINFFNLIVLIVPNWNLASSGIDLLSDSLSNYAYFITDRNLWSVRVQLRKEITRNEEGISHSNFLFVQGNSEFSVDFENIESNADNYIICPKGKNHPYNANTRQYLEPSDFEEKGNWDLRCFRHGTRYFLSFYLMNGDNYCFFSYIESSYQYDSSTQSGSYTKLTSNSNFSQMFDFKLENGDNYKDSSNNNWKIYKMLAIISENENIKLKCFKFEFHNYDFGDSKVYMFDSSSSPNEVNLTKAQSYNKAIFKNMSDEFYFMTYNNISDFLSGYSLITTSDYNEIGNVTFHINEESPFEFFEELEIREMNFLLYNKYIYYIIYNNQTNITYHGIFDVTLNKIMFNTNEDIDVFIPYSNNSMLAITKQTAYRICPIQDSNGECIEDCSSGNLILDVDGNKCGTSCDSGKYLLIPNNICIKECNATIFIQNSIQHCGLCKDMNNSYPYKIMGSTECLSAIPEGAEILYYKYYLLKCKEGYYFKNNNCLKICKNDKCLYCNEQSDSFGLCLSCNDSFIKINYNNNSFFDCVRKDDPILEKFYYNETLDAYKPCFNLCKTCLKEGNNYYHNCLECINEYMIRPWDNPYNICVEYSEFYYISKNIYHPLVKYECPEEAKYYLREKKLCIDNCSNIDLYKYSFNGNCLKECPYGTYSYNSICKISNPEKCFFYENYFEFNIDDILNQITKLIKSYLLEFIYTINFVNIYKYSNNDKIILFKNPICIEELNISTYDLITCYQKRKEDFNMGIFVLLLNEETVNFQILFFDVYTLEQKEIGDICKEYNETLIIPDSNNDNKNNINEIISNFDGNTILIPDESKTYQISYLSKQMQNLSVINLGYCENILKEQNGIDLKEELIIYKIEYYFPEFQIPIIEYKIFDKKGNQLSLDCCSNTSIEYQIPVTINESEIYKYDPNSFYYNDKCYPVESNNGIDMTVYDRKSEYNYNNMSLCQSDCTFKSYNADTKKAICDCSIVSKLPFDDILNVDKDIFLKNFINIKDLLNIDVVKCYKLIFVDNGLLKNYGSYILLSIILISIISSVILRLKEFTLIKNRIEKIIENKTNIKNELNSEIKLTNKEKSIKNLNHPKKRKRKSKVKKNKSKSLIVSSKNIVSKNKENNFNIIEPISEKKMVISEEYNDYEMNNLVYERALLIDKRTYWQYYLSLIKTKQLLIFSFYLSTDYNLKTIKINLFFLTFALNLTVNAFFFNDSTMHKIYQDEGSYNFLYQLPQIIYSLLITIFIKMILSMLSLTEKGIVKLKEEKNIVTNKLTEEIKCLKIKLIIFFVLEFIFLLFFWYYLSCFCALYKNTQMHLIKDTLTSFALSLFYPFALNLIPGLFRISAINKKDKNSKCLYKISQIFQLI